MNDQKLQMIIKYLDNQMSEEERVAFEKELRNDEVLAKEVAFQRGLHGFLDRRQPALELDLSNLGDEFILNSIEKRKKNSVWWAIPILLMLGTILYFAFFNQKTSSSIEENSTTIENTTEPAPIERDKGEDTPQQEENQEQENTENTETDEPQQIPIDQPIAGIDKSDFNRNPTMESIIADTYRNDDANKTVVTSPEMDATFSYQKNISFNIKGKTNIEPNYRIIIYSNRSFDIDNDYRLLDILTLGQKDNDSYQFNFSSKLALEKGLYYLIIRKDGSREVLHISRFTVK